MIYKQIDKKSFPQKLKGIKNPPEKVYAIGDISLIYENSFGIVGTRKITEYGIKNCEYFSKEFALRGIPTVSGMAIGTDSVVHKTTLEYDGKTIAVLGSGFNNIYPQVNYNLFNQIIEKGGLVITEFEENVPPLKQNFPRRNRIITALSEGILVIEAASKSGTCITVKNAKEQDKKVFALPGKIDSPVGVGVNNMIKDGAILTTDIQDIILSYPQFVKKVRKTEITKSFKSQEINDEYKEIYEYLQESKKASFDEILFKTQKSIKELLRLLTNMELDRIIIQDVAGNYIIHSEEGML